METLLLKYSSLIGFRNVKTSKYLVYDSKKTVFNSNGLHPFLKIKSEEINSNSIHEFTINMFDKPDFNGIMTFGTPILIQASDGKLLSCESNGDLKFEKLKFDEIEKNSMLLKMSKWVILDVNNPISKRQITIYDDIVIKSPYGTFLISDIKNNVFGGGPNISENSTWKIHKANTPYMPDWMFLRPNLNHNYLLPKFDLISSFPSPLIFDKGDKKTLGSFDYQTQEYMLIEDILYCMMSVEGNYIKKVTDVFDKSKYNYCIESYLEAPTCESSLRQLTNKILPICFFHDQIEIFINIHSQFEYGTVSQALCAALQTLMREYILLINQLDTEFLKGDLNLQKLWYYLQPSLKIMESLSKLTINSEKIKGGALLSRLYQLMGETTDQQALQIYNFLLNKSFVPYMEFLGKWIYKGIIEDIYEEFLIIEKSDISKEGINKDYKELFWEKRFALRKDQIPNFLTKHSEIVLLTGKYLNVIIESTNNLICPFTDDLNLNYENLITTQDFTEPITKAYDWANKQLVNLIMKDQQLIQRLKSIKRYFFIETGDFFVHFIDASEEELSKNLKSVSKEKLESLLEISIRTSSANSDPYKEDLICELYPYTLIEQVFAMQNIMGNNEFNIMNDKNNIYTPIGNVKGIEAFTLDYKVKWPLNLILSRKTLIKYQILFRHLFYCKYVERQLCCTWLLHQSTKELNVQKMFISSYGLTQRMLNFSKNLVYNLCYEVLERKWIKLEQDLKNVEKFEEISNLHNNFLDDCLKESLIMDNNLLKILSKINNTCLIFSRIIQSFTQNLKFTDGLFNDNEYEQKIEDVNNLEKRKNRIREDSLQTEKLIEEQSHIRVISKFSIKFDESLKNLIMTMNENTANKHDIFLFNLLSRLDFDGFYSNYFKLNQNQNNFFMNFNLK